LWSGAGKEGICAEPLHRSRRQDRPGRESSHRCVSIRSPTGAEFVLFQADPPEFEFGITLKRGGVT